MCKPKVNLLFILYRILHPYTQETLFLLLIIIFFQKVKCAATDQCLAFIVRRRTDTPKKYGFF
jgi:hypothetical protein